MICNVCDSMLVFKEENNKVLLVCEDCGYTEENEKATKNLVLQEEIKHTEKDKIEIVETDEIDPSVNSEIREELTEAYRESMSSIN